MEMQGCITEGDWQAGRLCMMDEDGVFVCVGGGRWLLVKIRIVL